jgi:hypothetical protein
MNMYCRGDFSGCIAHLDAALAIQPLVATAWYLRGIACMRTQVKRLLHDVFSAVQKDDCIVDSCVYLELERSPRIFQSLHPAGRRDRRSLG